MSRIEREKKIIGVMVDIYCKKKHKHKDGLCEECQECESRKSGSYRS